MQNWVQNELLLVSFLAFLVSVVLTPILRDIFRIYNVVDRPGYRRVHVHPIPRIGGIPIAVAYAVALFSMQGDTLGFNVWKLLPGVAIVFITGLIDDFIPLRPLVKLGGQIAAALTVFAMGLSVQTLAADELPLWLNLGLTVFWLLLTTNALNLIDGLDGLCGGIGLLASLTMFGAAVLHGNQELAYATLPLACALAGFLCYNINPATVFLGDSGALMIGFLLGCYGMIWTQKTSTLFSILLPLMALSVPLLDVVVAVARRTLRRQPIFGADRAHIHHRLLDRGLTPKNTVLVLYVFAALAAGLALLLTAPQVQKFQQLLVGLLVAAFVFGLRELRYKEFRFFGQMLFGGAIQQGLQSKLQLDALSVLLDEAQTVDEWWDRLSQKADEFCWLRLTLELPDLRREITRSLTPPLWTFTVPLGEGGQLRIDGGKDQHHRGLVLEELASVVSRSVSRLVVDPMTAAPQL